MMVALSRSPATATLSLKVILVDDEFREFKSRPAFVSASSLGAVWMMTSTFPVFREGYWEEKHLTMEEEMSRLEGGGRTTIAGSTLARASTAVQAGSDADADAAENRGAGVTRDASAEDFLGFFFVSRRDERGGSSSTLASTISFSATSSVASKIELLGKGVIAVTEDEDDAGLNMSFKVLLATGVTAGNFAAAEDTPASVPEGAFADCCRTAGAAAEDEEEDDEEEDDEDDDDDAFFAAAAATFCI